MPPVLRVIEGINMAFDVMHSPKLEHIEASSRYPSFHQSIGL